MMTTLLILGAGLGVLLSGFVSAVETGSYTLNRVRLRVRADQNQPGARRLAQLIERQNDLVLTALLGNTLADYVGTACVTALLISAACAPGSAELWATVIMTPMLLVFGGILPKDWFRREADRWMYPLALPLSVSVQAVRWTGFLALMQGLTRMILARIDPLRAEGQDTLPRTHIVRLLHEGAALGGLTDYQRDLMDRVMNLSNVRVGSIMVARQRAATVPDTIARDDFLRIARMAHFSRLPVWRDDPRRIIGIVCVFDVLTDAVHRPIVDYARPPVRLPDYARVSAALLQLQRARQTMAIVEDRQGHCVGLLTLKDLVEEIVGDIDVW